MALKNLVVSGREAGLMKENERLKRALRMAKSDLLEAVKEIDRELAYTPAISNGQRETEAK